MAQLSTTNCRLLARARRDKGLTQSALAQAVGCKQSAVSMLECGQPAKLSQEAVDKIAAVLGVALEPVSEAAAVPAAALSLAGRQGYCPSAACPSNVPYAVTGELLFWPRPQAAAAGRRCVFCGEVLETRCPQCGAAVTDGACCGVCGAVRVAQALPEGVEAAEWAARRCRELAEWRALVETTRRGPPA